MTKKIKLDEKQTEAIKKALLSAYEGGKNDTTALNVGMEELIDGPVNKIEKVMKEFFE